MALTSIRERLVRRVAVPLFSLAMFVGCADQTVGPAAPPMAPRLTTAGSADAETLFRGIVLGAGPTADEIPEIRDNFKVDLLATNSMSLSYLQNLHNQIVTEVNAIDPNFLAGFKTAMNSGDPAQIDAKLDEAFAIGNDAIHRLMEGDTIRALEADPAQVDQRLQPYLDANGNLSLGDTLVTTTGASNELTSSTTSDYTVGGCSDPTQVICDEPMAIPVYVWYYGVHVALVYNVYIAVTWGIFLAIDVPRLWNLDSDLMRDQIVNSIAQRLAV
jgi:SdpC family antimicrobial peptide